MSPKLYNVYVDELSSRLLDSQTGCHMNGVCMNHVMYADDLTLMAPSAKGLQKLLDVCAEYAREFDIIFNVDKSVCMYYMPCKLRLLNIPYVLLNGVKLVYKETQKLLGMMLDNRD